MCVKVFLIYGLLVLLGAYSLRENGFVAENSFVQVVCTTAVSESLRKAASEDGDLKSIKLQYGGLVAGDVL